MPYPRTACLRGARIIKDRAHLAYAEVRPTILLLRDKGLSCDQIAQRLNKLGHRTRRGRPYRAMQVWRVLRFYTGDIDASQLQAANDP
jgi:hypothetical protein